MNNLNKKTSFDELPNQEINTKCFNNEYRI